MKRSGGAKGDGEWKLRRRKRVTVSKGNEQSSYTESSIHSLIRSCRGFFKLTIWN